MAKTDNLSDFLTDVANSIRTKTQTSEPINAQDFSDKILSIQTGGGVAQPTLFPPIVLNDNINIISWGNNEQNGGFPVTVTAKVDNTTCSSPLHITEELNNKTLSITASSTNFNNAITTKTLNYISAPDYSGGFAINGLNVDATQEDALIMWSYSTNNHQYSVIDVTTSEEVKPYEQKFYPTDGIINSNYMIRKDKSWDAGIDRNFAVVAKVDSTKYSNKNINIKFYKNGVFLTEYTNLMSELPEDNEYGQLDVWAIPYLCAIHKSGWLYIYRNNTENSLLGVGDFLSCQITISDPA